MSVRTAVDDTHSHSGSVKSSRVSMPPIRLLKAACTRSYSNSKVVVAGHFDLWLLAIEFADSIHPLADREQGVLIGIDAHSDENPVEQGKEAPDDVVVTHGERVESAYKECR